MDYSATEAQWLYERLGARDRLAMVVRKTVGRMKESSTAERVITALFSILIAIMGFVAIQVWEMKGQFGVVMYHIDNHPNVAIESDVEDLQQRMREHEIGHPR